MQLMMQLYEIECIFKTFVCIHLATHAIIILRTASLCCICGEKQINMCAYMTTMDTTLLCNIFFFFFIQHIQNMLGIWNLNKNKIIHTARIELDKVLARNCIYVLVYGNVHNLICWLVKNKVRIILVIYINILHALLICFEPRVLHNHYLYRQIC